MGISADPLFRLAGRAVPVLVVTLFPSSFLSTPPSSGLSLLRTGTQYCADNLHSEFWCHAVSAYTLLQSVCYLTPCICFAKTDSHRETGAATPTRQWVHRGTRRTPWHMRMLSVILATLPPLRSALPDGRARTVSCWQRPVPLRPPLGAPPLPPPSMLRLNSATLGRRCSLLSFLAPVPPAAAVPCCDCGCRGGDGGAIAAAVELVAAAAVASP